MCEADYEALRPVKDFNFLYAKNEKEMETFHIVKKSDFDQLYYITDEAIYFKITAPNMYIPLVLVLQKTSTVYELLYNFSQLNRISVEPKLLDRGHYIDPEESLESCFIRESPRFTLEMNTLRVELE
jgi:hypothetical protein